MAAATTEAPLAWIDVEITPHYRWQVKAEIFHAHPEWIQELQRIGPNAPTLIPPLIEYLGQPTPISDMWEHEWIAQFSQQDLFQLAAFAVALNLLPLINSIGSYLAKWMTATTTSGSSNSSSIQTLASRIAEEQLTSSRDCETHLRPISFDVLHELVHTQ